MPVPRLILCDGLPGSGKTTTTQQLWLHLDSLGQEARWWFEHELGHPVLALGQARDALHAGLPEFRRVLSAAHDGWASLVHRLSQGPGTTLLEGTLFQATLGSQLLMDLPRAEIIAHFDRTRELIAASDPVLIHLRPENVEAALQATCARRGGWFWELLQGEFAASARGRRIGRNDFAALVDYFAERRDLSDEFVARFPGRVLVHDNSDGDWERQRRAITGFLNLPPIIPAARPENAEAFAGRYRAATGDEWWVGNDATGLLLEGEHPARLLPHGRDRFVIEGLCVELVFERANDGRVMAIACAGQLPELPPRWVRD